MINTRIAYTQEDGTVAIVCPALQCPDVATLLESVPEGAQHEVIHTDFIPAERYFRNAWRLGEGIEIDRPHAEKIHMDNLRKVRDEKLKAGDIEYQKALEMRDDATMNAVANKKQKLRDMPQNTDLSSLSLDELKYFIPAVLKEGV